MSVKKLISFLLFFVLLNTALAVPQNKNENTVVLGSGDTIQIQALALSDISLKIEETSLSLNKINTRLKDNSELKAIDSIVSQKKPLLETDKKEVLEEIEQYSTREIEDVTRKWDTHIKELKTYQEKLTKQTKKLEDDNEFIIISIRTWEYTHITIKEQKGPKETLERITSEIKELNSFEKKIRNKLNRISKIQNNITDLILLSEKLIRQMENEHMNWQSEFLKQDSPAIWVKSDTIAADTTAKEKRISVTLGKNTQLIKEYFSGNTDRLYLQLIILVLLTFLFYKYNRKLQGIEIAEDDSRMQKVRFFAKHYFSSVLLLTLILSIWIHPDRPRAVNELFVLVLLIPSIYLYEKILTTKLKRYIIPIIIIFLLDELQLFVEFSESFYRFVLLIKALVPMWLLYMMVHPKKAIRFELKGKWWVFAFKTAYIFLVLSVISLFANIFGYTNLAMLFSRVVTLGILFGIMLSLTVGIIVSLLIMMFQSKFMKGSNLVKNHQQLIEKRVLLFLQLYALFLWLKAILNTLGAKNLFSNWVTSIMESSWDIGSTSISFGGIINFFMVIIAASIIAKIIKGLLEEELFPRISLPRGVPGAISMLVRYFIIGWGLYVALDSAGVKMSSLGLLAGALGVGIGFGLQNIVANFISGLILAFERPIQTGDTIEVGTLMGDVKEIGVRASTIKTFDGSEVIVPNSNLITHEVTNWTLSDRRRRRDIEISAAYGTNPRKVLEIIRNIATDHPSVIKNPGVWATFEGFGASSLNFKVRFWVSFDIGLTVKSEVAMNIYDAFEEAGIRIPFPQQDLHIKSFDPTVQKTIFPGVKNTDEDEIEKK